MKTITKQFLDLYKPKQALLIYQHMMESPIWAGVPKFYVESYDIGPDGRPINAHPLTEAEAVELSKSLYDAYTEKTAFLCPKGLLPRNVLYINPSPENGYAVWYTPMRKRLLYFTDNLSIPNGAGYVPALVWKATKKSLTLFALPSNRKPGADTPLYYAPFFNTAESVCMGTVEVRIPKGISLESFMQAWEDYFFNSYFSHTLGTGNVEGNIVQLWQSQIETGAKFPVNALKKSASTLKHLIK
jgi:PRTRC genetic system protein B